jgi:hypothetical protein
MDCICIYYRLFYYCLYERNMYVLHFCRRGVSWRVCYKLQSKNIAWQSRINFHLLPYEFEIGLYVNFGKWWNIKFQAK